MGSKRYFATGVKRDPSVETRQLARHSAVLPVYAHAVLVICGFGRIIDFSMLCTYIVYLMYDLRTYILTDFLLVSGETAVAFGGFSVVRFVSRLYLLL